VTELTLKARINEDMKTAMRAKDSARLGVIRLIQAEIKQREVDERITLDDAQVIAVLNKMIKQRRDSVEQFQAAGRTDLVDKETFELQVVQAYLPEALSAAEVEGIIQESIKASGASGMKDMGAVMNLLRPKLQGRADMGEVSKKVKSLLAP
jgi:uncharacterized protein YqeY